MSAPQKITKAQKVYIAACNACRSWAATVSPDILRMAENDRVAKSYGISPSDASGIISTACRERNI